MRQFDLSIPSQVDENNFYYLKFNHFNSNIKLENTPNIISILGIVRGYDYHCRLYDTIFLCESRLAVGERLARIMHQGVPEGPG